MLNLKLVIKKDFLLRKRYQIFFWLTALIALVLVTTGSSGSLNGTLINFWRIV